MLILELSGVFGVQTPLQKKTKKQQTTLMTEPLVNLALAQFLCGKLPSPARHGILGTV